MRIGFLLLLCGLGCFPPKTTPHPSLAVPQPSTLPQASTPPSLPIEPTHTPEDPLSGVAPFRVALVPVPAPPATIEVEEGKSNIKAIPHGYIIKPTLEGLAPMLRLCYEKELLSNPLLQGAIEVRFLVSEEGVVSDVSVTKSDLPKRVDVCVVGVFAQARFLYKGKLQPAEVNYSVSFQPYL